jgi:hypothetical protein
MPEEERRRSKWEDDIKNNTKNHGEDLYKIHLAQRALVIIIIMSDSKKKLVFF